MKKLTLFILYFICFSAFSKAQNVNSIDPMNIAAFEERLQKKLINLEREGTFNRLNKALQRELHEQMQYPPSVAGLHITTHPRTWLFNPTVTVPYDLKNAKGEVIIAKGTAINPLSTTFLPYTLIFYNAEDVKQIKWAQLQENKFQGKTKLILVSGSPAIQTSLFKKPVFFDQGGRLITRFGITQIPAMVQQEGNRLRISEVHL